jgi:hypothetical protein
LVSWWCCFSSLCCSDTWPGCLAEYLCKRCGALIMQAPKRTIVALVMGLAAVVPRALAADASQFDGTWNVTLSCEAAWGLHAYAYQFTATVASGLLHGQYGTPGHSSSVALDGTIEPTGTAALFAKGLSGEPDHRFTNPPQSAPYAYRVTARFDGSQGTGSRVQGGDCSFTFVKQ